MTSDHTGHPADSGSTANPGNAAFQARWASSLMPALGQPDLALVRGEGATVWDADGRRYEDFLSGVAVNVLGHAHPAIVAAVTRQVATLGHVSNLFMAEPTIALAERLLHASGRDGRVFFCNSGAEANEAAFKIARRTGRTTVVAAEGAFHGRTMGALALTGQPDKRDPFQPLPGPVVHVPFGDTAALDAAVTGDTAAVLLEPIQGEYGVRPAPAGYLEAAREITAARGALLMLDEVQTGVGRTGVMFAHQAAGIAPDVVTLAKGLGGGLPLGACVAFGAAATLLEPGQHASTFGGNPVACAAGLAVLDTLTADDLPGRAKTLGERIAQAVTGLAHPLVASVRGSGLLLGVVLTAPVAARVQRAARDAGFLVNAVAPDVVRLAPPLVVTDDQVDALLAALPAVLDAAAPAGTEHDPEAGT
jgi:acetylornithine/N-succinyldiaminopimelate aminotransferase